MSRGLSLPSKEAECKQTHSAQWEPSGAANACIQRRAPRGLGDTACLQRKGWGNKRVLRNPQKLPLEVTARGMEVSAGQKSASVLISEIAAPCFSLGIACARVISVCAAPNICDTRFVTVCPLGRDRCHWEGARHGRASVVLAEDRRKQTDATYKARQCINH